jgi:predicted dehydrogenase
MNGPLGWAIVGCGRVADRRIAPALRTCADARLVAFCSRDLQRARDYADRHGAERAYDDLDRLLRDDAAQVIYIATPNALHREQTCRCLEAGKHVLVDKPIGMNAPEARRMIDGAQRVGRRLGVMHQQRFHPANQFLLKWIADGNMGELLSVRAQMGFWHPDNGNWRLSPALSGGGPVMDLGPHALDIILRLVGMPRGVEARLRNLHFHYAVEDHADVRMEFAGGAIGSMELSYCAHHYGGRLEVFGTRGSVLIDGSLQQSQACRLWTRREDQSVHEELPVASADAYALALNDFNDAVLTRRPPVVQAETALQVMTVIDDIKTAATSRETPRGTGRGRAR